MIKTSKEMPLAERLTIKGETIKADTKVTSVKSDTSLKPAAPLGKTEVYAGATTMRCDKAVTEKAVSMPSESELGKTGLIGK